MPDFGERALWTLDITGVHMVGITNARSEGVLEPLEPFVSFAFCILRIINYLTGTLRHSVCTLQKHKIISCQGPSANTGVVFQHGLHVRFRHDAAAEEEHERQAPAEP